MAVASPFDQPPDDMRPDDVPASLLAAIEDTTQQVGRTLLGRLERPPATPLARRWWDDRILAWAMRDERLKVELFRFVDVLPMLANDQAVVDHLQQYLGEAAEHVPAALRAALGLARRTPLTRSGVARAARLGTLDFARRFIAGSNVDEVLAAAWRQRQLRRCFTLDILGEAVASDGEADGYFAAYRQLIDELSPRVAEWPADLLLDADDRGPLPRMNLSVKLSALDSQFDAADFVGSAARVGARLRELLLLARERGAFVNVDMESYDKKNLTLHAFCQTLGADELREVIDVGVVIQCYLKDSLADLVRLRDWARRRGAPVWVRLVKGAYWDSETVIAGSHGWPTPVFTEKWRTDANFERATRFVLANRDVLRPALGSHNLRSVAHSLAAAEHLGIPRSALEVQMLYGMGDEEQQALVDAGCRLRIYMPYGELIPGMAYLVRRLLENTSNESFLRAEHDERSPPDELLAAPAAVGALADSKEQRRAMTSTSQSELERFRNEPPVDFSQAAARRAMTAALADVRRRLGKNYPLVIGARSLDTDERIVSRDPSRWEQVVGETASATASHAHEAVLAARAALPRWAGLGARRRADFLRQAAETMRRRLFELAAWEVYECGKPWREATGDIDEAIDFLEYYAAGAIDLERPGGANLPGEENRFVYVPRGVTAVIAPWNFPLAIVTGMTAAALAVGNTVVVKPAEQSPVMAALLTDIFQSVDLPPGVLNYLPGVGEVAGAALVEHPDVALIAFTGSRQVGLAINARAAQASAAPGAKVVKKVIAELGGKNAIIVDDDADLDEAVTGVVKSAFGYAGQKCSACSRAIVLAGVYDRFVERLIEAARSLKIGPAESPATTVGPVIDRDAQQRVLRYIEIARGEGRPLLETDVGELAATGCFVGPHIFADLAPAARTAQEEVFGPLLAVLRAADLDEALRIANGVDYALTGGVFSRSPANLARVEREFQAGNLYLNRPITGALVGRQPFGGYKMSGIGSKAGGPDYLLQFVTPRTITEHTLRRGFAPPAGES